VAELLGGGVLGGGGRDRGHGRTWDGGGGI
jgi:hypothetical protein